jgi:hypothetical protein
MPALKISCTNPSVSYPLPVSFSSKPSPSAKSTWSYGGSTATYSSFNSSGYLANPSHSAQIQARDAGALTNYEASRMGLSNRR